MQHEVITLRALRLDEDLTYMELAEQTGLHYSTLVKILAGQNSPNDRTLHKIRRFLTTRKSATKTRKAGRA